MEFSLNLKNPPIKEAILNIQVESPAELKVETLAKCRPQALKRQYPNQSNTQEFTSEFGLGANVKSSASTQHKGYVFGSRDEKQAYQVSASGFTFNRLARYPGWATFYSEAKKLWDMYCSVVNPASISRVSLRYINRFDIPLASVELEEHFRTFPVVPHKLPQTMVGFFFRYNLMVEEIQSVATITLVPDAPAQEGHSSIILDIDLFRQAELPEPGDSEGLARVFESMKPWKNKIFSDCLTESTLKRCS